MPVLNSALFGVFVFFSFSSHGYPKTTQAVNLSNTPEQEPTTSKAVVVDSPPKSVPASTETELPSPENYRQRKIDSDRRNVPGRGLRAGGIALFSTFYLLGVLPGIGLLTEGEAIGTLLLVPGVGPLIMGFYEFANDDWLGLNRIIGGCFVGVALFQILGASLAIAGFKKGAEYKAAARANRESRRKLSFAPVGPRGGPGVSLSVVF